MASNFTAGKFQALNATGIVPGAKLYTYAAGTTTPLATYTTQAATSANSNPVLCDARGQASVWLSATAYRMILKDASDVTIWDQDNITELDPSTVTSRNGETFTATNYATLALAAAAAQDRKLIVPAGSYPVTSDLDCGTATLEFLPGALVNVTAGKVLIIRKPIIAGSYKIFETSGVIISAGVRNPVWWGLVSSRTDPGPAVAATNTTAMRKAAMSMYAEYVLNAGTLAAPGPCVPFSVVIPDGLFYLSNGFTAPVGAPVRGSGASTCLCRLSSNADTDTAVPLLTVGQSFGVAPGLAYQNDPGTSQSSGTFAASGFAQTAAAASNLYFVDQNASAGAFAPRYPGVQFSDLFFTSCGLAINLTNTGDLTGSNIVIDMGLTGISLANCQNIRMTNVVIYDVVSQAIAVGTNVFDTSIEAHIEYPQGIAVNIGGAGTVHNLKFPNFTVTQNGSVGTNAVVVNASDVDVEFQDATFRNLGNCSAVQINGSQSNVVVRMNSATFDGLRTNPVYNQNSNMQAFSVAAGQVILDNCVMRNLGTRSVFSGTANLIVNGLTWSSCSGTAGLFDLITSTGGSATFFHVKGDAITPLLYQSGGLATLRVKHSTDWLGTSFTDGSFLAWTLTLPAAGQMLVTVTAQTDATSGVRKSATYIFEKSVELLPTVTDTITSSKLHASPVTNTHPELAPTMVFVSSGTSTQNGTGVTNATGKLRIPNTYSNATANVDYLA